MRRVSISKLVLGAVLLLSPPLAAQADTVFLSLINPGSLTKTYSFSFDAAGSATILTFGGYQIPGWETVDGITLRLDGAGDNLIQGKWYPGVGNSPYAYVARDSSDIQELVFGGIVVGHYDTYWQTISTVDGGSYTLSFIYSNNPGGPSAYDGSAGFFVSSKAAGQISVVGFQGSSLGGVPEPATWALTLLGLAALGYVGQKRQRAKAARVVA
jgi:hypothetical protein